MKRTLCKGCSTRQQADVGIDVVSDGEFGKVGLLGQLEWSAY
jgi:hypothetical protein